MSEICACLKFCKYVHRFFDFCCFLNFSTWDEWNIIILFMNVEFHKLYPLTSIGIQIIIKIRKYSYYNKIGFSTVKSKKQKSIRKLYRNLLAITTVLSF